MSGRNDKPQKGLTPRFVPLKPLARPDEKLLLTNGRFIDVHSGSVRKETFLLIQKGKIQGLFADGSLVQSDREVDLQGAYVLPGLMNAHCHMTAPGGVGFGIRNLWNYKRQLERNAEECIKHGVTTVRDMLAFSGWLAELKGKIARKEIVGPRILQCCALDVGKGYGESMAILRQPLYFQRVGSPIQGREAVKTALDRGADHIKLFQQPVSLILPRKPFPVMDELTISAIVEESEKRGAPVAMHQTRIAGFRKGLNGNIPSLEHMPRDEVATDEDLRRLQDSHAWMVPTLSASIGLAHNRKGDMFWGKGHLPQWTAWRRTHMEELIREFCEPVFAASSIESFGKLADPASYEKRHLFPWPDQEQFTASLTVGAANARRFYDAGIPMGCGNDGGVPFAWPGSLGLEMLLLEQIGMQTSDVLRMATINNARLLKMDKDLGSLDPGKIADLAILRDNPLETVQNVARPIGVWVNGQPVYEAH